VIIHGLLVSRAQTALDLSHKIATKRSGQRGHTARQALLAAENELATIQAQDPQIYVTSQMVHDIMTEVFGAYEALDVEADEARAKTILRGVGFGDDELNKEGKQISGLSGGWRMRVMLGKALYVKPDILLLDEPSRSESFLCFGICNICPLLANHLDLPAIVWLESYLTNETEGQTVVVVSHDRNFLDSVTDETIIFRDKKLTYHPGNYEDWEKNTEEQKKRKARLKEVTFLTHNSLASYSIDASWNKKDARKSRRASRRAFRSLNLLGTINAMGLSALGKEFSNEWEWTVLKMESGTKNHIMASERLSSLTRELKLLPYGCLPLNRSISRAARSSSSPKYHSDTIPNPPLRLSSIASLLTLAHMLESGC
jgi:ATPase subunit of ABC transporter with duplicated ATPase domains